MDKAQASTGTRSARPAVLLLWKTSCLSPERPDCRPGRRAASLRVEARRRVAARSQRRWRSRFALAMRKPAVVGQDARGSSTASVVGTSSATPPFMDNRLCAGVRQGSTISGMLTSPSARRTTSGRGRKTLRTYAYCASQAHRPAATVGSTIAYQVEVSEARLRATIAARTTDLTSVTVSASPPFVRKASLHCFSRRGPVGS